MIRFVSIAYTILLFSGLPLMALNGLSHPLKIKLYSQSKIYQINFKPEKGSFKIIGDKQHLFIIDAQSSANIYINGDSLLLKVLNDTIGKFSQIYFASDHTGPSFYVKPLLPERKVRLYDDNCIISAEAGQLKIINLIALENYVSGSVQAEGGSYSPFEYQKIQAVLCRTFAVKNLFRHEDEGFDVCDHVHCQAYLGKSNSKSVMQATSATYGEVVVDQQLNLITSAYHSNSGGQTANSEDAWSLPSDYLKSIADSFAIGMPNAKWEKTITKQSWINYLSSKMKLDFSNDSVRYKAFHFTQQSRKAAIEIGQERLLLKDVRNDLKLKSSFFSLVEQGDDIVFKGKGFGHGVGLCQEGAMVMAKKGYTYKKILSYYYSSTKLLPIEEMNFFKD
jgi:stage II sporulation protein D